jgi:hypothetical protein
MSGFELQAVIFQVIRASDDKSLKTILNKVYDAVPEEEKKRVAEALKSLADEL